MVVTTWQIARNKMSVKLNGLYMPFNAARASLRRFAYPLSFHNPGSDHELSMKGSCTLVRLKGKLTLVSTAHQLREETGPDRTPNEILLTTNPTSDGKKLVISGSEATRIKYPPEADLKPAEDILMLTFDPKFYSMDPTPLFWNLYDIASLNAVKLENVLLFFTIGFPTAFTGYDSDFDDETGASTVTIRSKPCLIYLTPDSASDLEFHRKFRIREESQGTVSSFDGFSGAPAFFIYRDAANNHHVGFAGMVKSAGCGIFYVYDGQAVRTLLEGL